MYHIVICDDDPISIAQMEECLLNLTTQTNDFFEIESYFSGEKFLNQYLSKQMKIDILFLDIEMERRNGIEVAKRIREEDAEMIIIFFSSHEKYLIDLFQVSPFRFIPKPLEINTVQNITLSAIKKINLTHQFFDYTFKQKYAKVYLKDIVYFESSGRTVNIIGKDSQVLGTFYARLQDVEDSLQTDLFIRIHQSYLVNYLWIKTLSQKELETFDYQVLKISEDRSKSVRENYIQLARREVIQ